MKEFPVESKIAYEYNRRHITEDLGHPGNIFYHLNNLPITYDYVLIVFLVMGLVNIFKLKEADKKLTTGFVAMIAVMFLFFSLIVETKMPAFVYPVSALMLIIMAYGFYVFCEWFIRLLIIRTHHRLRFYAVSLLIFTLIALKPWMIMVHRSEGDEKRNNKIYNSEVFKNLDEALVEKYIILNTKPYENIELMFYRNAVAYNWFPAESVLDSLQAEGYKFAAFQYNNDQVLPEYILHDREIIVLSSQLKDLLY